MATKITVRFGEKAIPATLNDSETAQAFAAKLPATISVSGTGIDFCGRMPWKLPYRDEQIGRGWKNGDVNYNPGGGWFAILFDDEENSTRYGDQVNMGRLDCDPRELHALDGAYDVVVEVV